MPSVLTSSNPAKLRELQDLFMKEAAKNLDFEKAGEIRDRLKELKEMRIFV
jgi:excinuclease UvrABC helicase subunit UvrB